MPECVKRKIRVESSLAAALLACSMGFGQSPVAPPTSGSQAAPSSPPVNDVAIPLGPFLARSFNFGNRYGTHLPFQFHIIDSSRINNNDLFGGVWIDRTILSGAENFLAPPGHRLDCGNNGCSRFENAQALRLTLATHAPVQIGGMVDGEIRSYAPGDSISMTFVNRYTGVSRGTDEGAHLLRTDVTPILTRWGGRILSIDRTPATEEHPRGNVGVSVKGCAGCALDASAEGGAPVINLSRPMPMGNVTRVEVYAPDPRFIVLTVDGGGKALPASHWTNLTAAVDSRVDGGSCVKPGETGKKVQWAATDPFRADEAGLGNTTALHCFSVTSTAGLAAGTVVVIGGEGPELETTQVIRVVDATHFIANAHMPHPGPSPSGSKPAVPGDVVTWGGLAGYAAGFTADTVAPRSMNEADRKQRGWSPAVCDFVDCNNTPLYLTPLVMASLPGNRLVVYINFEAASHTLNTFGLMSNEPRRAARMTARVEHGQVVSVKTLSTGDYRMLRTTVQGMGVDSGQNRLPPPRITLAGCRVQPTITAMLAGGIVQEIQPDGAVVKLGGGLTVEPHLDPGNPGQGCPEGGSVPLEVESHYSNPLVAYPAALVYRAIRPGEQREDLNSEKGYQLWMPPSGQFAVGDDVLASTWPLQFVGDIQLYGRNLGFNSARFGAIQQWLFRGQSNQQPMIAITNQTTPYRYYSDAEHGYAATADGGGMTEAPDGIRFTGAYATIFDVGGVPRQDVDGTPGSFATFGCSHAPLVESLCGHNVLNPFNLFLVQPVLGGKDNRSEQRFTLDPQHHRWNLSLGAADGVIASDATIEAPALKLGSAGCTGCALPGQSNPVGGAALQPGQCATGTARVPGALVGTPVAIAATDGSLPGGVNKVDAAVTAPNLVSVEVCAIAPNTPPRRIYQVRVLP